MSPPRRLLLVLLALVLTACVPKAAPAPAELRQTPPPWPAPRDGISYFEAAGVPSSRLDDTTDQQVLTLSVSIDGQTVPLVPNIGLDLPRALQGPAHTHDASGTVWLEGAGAREVTLGQFFTLWGVRFTADCLGAACGSVEVSSAAGPAPDPLALRLATAGGTVTVAVTTR
ncbi:MAG TPA: hypothetical protein PLE12_04990 [Propionicimonas sp.]|nr:hypothetical protein [Propionicimonas sp.]